MKSNDIMPGHLTYLSSAAVTLLLAIASCHKAVTPGRTTSLVALTAVIDDSGAAAATKGPYSGTAFTEGQDFGMGIVVHEEGTPSVFAPHMLGYGNLQVTSTGAANPAWTFRNSVVDATFPSLYISTRDDRATADIYAYAPFVQEASDLRAVPVDLSKNLDLMRAFENGSSNNNLTPDGNTIPVIFSFRHVLSRVRLGFRTKYEGGEHLLDSVVFKKTGSGSASVLSAGTFNVVDGTFSSIKSDSVRILFGNPYKRHPEYSGFSSTSDYKYFDCFICPTPCEADGDITIVMSIDGIRHKYAVRTSDIMHSDGTTCGFQPGYSYDFHFQVDNYVHLKGITIQSGWTAGDMEDIL